MFDLDSIPDETEKSEKQVPAWRSPKVCFWASATVIALGFAFMLRVNILFAMLLSYIIAEPVKFGLSFLSVICVIGGGILFYLYPRILKIGFSFMVLVASLAMWLVYHDFHFLDGTKAIPTFTIVMIIVGVTSLAICVHIHNPKENGHVGLLYRLSWFHFLSVMSVMVIMIGFTGADMRNADNLVEKQFLEKAASEGIAVEVVQIRNYKYTCKIESSPKHCVRTLD